MIPKTIFFCNKTLDNTEPYTQNWKRLNPDYEIKVYDDQMCIQFLVDHYDKTYAELFYFLKDGPIKADFWRICILYIFGGFYCDIDNEPFVPIQDFIEDVDFVTCSSYSNEFLFNPNFIASNKENSILKSCIDWYFKKYNRKDPYGYWDYSIMSAFSETIQLNSYEKSEGIYAFRSMKLQIIKECKGTDHYDAHNIYKGVRIFNNRYEDWDCNNHVFINSFTKILSSPSFVINLERCRDRFKYAEENIKNAGYTDIRLFEGVDGKNTENINHALYLFQNPPIDDIISNGQLGCLLSHMKILKHIIDDNIKISTVFEDDVCFHPDWNTLCYSYYKLTSSTYDIIFIGNELDSCKTNTPVTELITTEPVFCTHAYIITLEGARKLLNSLLRWDFWNVTHWSSENIKHTGLGIVDVMIKNIQTRCLEKQLEYPFVWYSWNGTKYPCKQNLLPITQENSRNTGLVFQNGLMESLIAGSNIYIPNIVKEIDKPKIDMIFSLYNHSTPQKEVDKESHTSRKIPDKMRMFTVPLYNTPNSINIFNKIEKSKSNPIPKDNILNRLKMQTQYHGKMKFHKFTHISI